MSEEQIIPKCKAIGAVNEEIIKRITTKMDSEVYQQYYVLQQITTDAKLQLGVKEVKEGLKVREVVMGWKKKVSLMVPVDLFKDKVDYGCESWEDLKRLNGSLLGVIEQYLFLDPVRAKSELLKFLNNFEVLQQCLGEIEDLIVVSPKSKKKVFETDLKKINQLLDSVFQKGLLLQLPIESSIVNGTVFPFQGKYFEGGVLSSLLKNGGKPEILLVPGTHSNGTYILGTTKYNLSVGEGNFILGCRHSNTLCSPGGENPLVLDLKTHALCPTHCNFTSEYGWPSYLGPYVLSGSNDGYSWNELQTKEKKDEKLYILEVNCDKQYRFFKIQKPNSQTLCSGWEMFGCLKTI